MSRATSTGRARFRSRESVKLTQAIAMAGGLMSGFEEARSSAGQIDRAQSDGDDRRGDRPARDRDEIQRRTRCCGHHDVVMVPESTRAKQAKTLLQALLRADWRARLGWGIFR
jgi:hypothetical protein